MFLAGIFILTLIAGLVQLASLSHSNRKNLVVLVFLLQVALIFLNFASHLPSIFLAGAWPHFAGIQWLGDEFSLALVTVVICLAFPTALNLCRFDRYFLSLFHFLVAALIGLFLSADLFNVYVLLELLLISSLLVFAWGAQKDRLRIFFWMNLLGSAFLLLSLIFVYQNLATLNMIEIGLRWSALSPGIQNLLLSSLSIGLLLKSAIFPLGIWAPTSYPGLPKSILAFMNAVPTKVGLYLLFRLGTLIAPDTFVNFKTLFLILGLTSLLAFGLCLLARKKWQESLIYFNLSHLSLLLISLSLSDFTLAFPFYLLTDMAVIAGLGFLAKDFADPEKGNLFSSRTGVCCFAFFALVASGIPPFAGFSSEVFLITASTTQPIIAIATLLLTLLSLILFLRKWNEEVQAETSPLAARQPIGLGTVISIFLLIALSILGIFGRDQLQIVANQFKNPQKIYQEIYQQELQPPAVSPSSGEGATQP